MEVINFTDPPWRYRLWFILALFPVLISAQTHGQGNFTSVGDAFWQLADLKPQPDSVSHRKPSLGGQNFTHCCLLAMNISLEVNNGTLIRKEPFYINATIDELLAANAADQFPCGASWNGNTAGAPKVKVPTWWLEKTCPGWQLSDSSKDHESQWISPFVGFLLPAIVFCLTVPRRRKLAVWKKLFVPDMSQLVSWILAPLAMIFAGLSVVCDTIIWLCICFAFASPMLLSGLYEAFLDNRIIGFLAEKTENSRLTLDMRARLLFVILVGNLDLEPEEREGDIELTVLNCEHHNDSDQWPNYKGDMARNASSPWTHVENLVYPLRSYRDMAICTPRQWPIHDVLCKIPGCTNLQCKEKPIHRDAWIQREIGRTKTRLRSMLACQYSFGATVGAPVVFFLGTFIFTIVSILSNLGDEDTSLALAFGIWYMIIPHISIVSGLLLAGNNPNTLEGVVALEFGDIEEETSFERKHFGTKLFELAYESRYKPKWLWLRGRSKRDWLERVWRTYEMRPPPGQAGKFIVDKDMAALKKATNLSFTSWLIVLGMTFLLMGIPFILAFITGFYTPQVGLSCRSFTFTIYAIAQLSQIALWLWAYIGPPQEGNRLPFFRKGGWLDRKGFYTPTAITTLWSRKTFFSLQSLWAITWYSLAAIFGLGGVTSSIGGTMMQLMGVYSSAKCTINAQWWNRPHGDVTVIVSTNYAQEIAYAKRFWLPCGITATLFLGAVSFCGWWYQRRLRGLFRNLVSDMGNPRTDREDINSVMRRTTPARPVAV